MSKRQTTRHQDRENDKHRTLEKEDDLKLHFLHNAQIVLTKYSVSRAKALEGWIRRASSSLHTHTIDQSFQNFFKSRTIKSRGFPVDHNIILRNIFVKIGPIKLYFISCFNIFCVQKKFSWSLGSTEGRRFKVDDGVKETGIVN